jgi:hypothetical protein
MTKLRSYHANQAVGFGHRARVWCVASVDTADPADPASEPLLFLSGGEDGSVVLWAAPPLPHSPNKVTPPLPLPLPLPRPPAEQPAEAAEAIAIRAGGTQAAVKEHQDKDSVEAEAATSRAPWLRFLGSCGGGARGRRLSAFALLSHCAQSVSSRALSARPRPHLECDSVMSAQGCARWPCSPRVTGSGLRGGWRVAAEGKVNARALWLS